MARVILTLARPIQADEQVTTLQLHMCILHHGVVLEEDEWQHTQTRFYAVLLNCACGDLYTTSAQLSVG